MNQLKKHEQRIAILLSAVAGAIFFIYLYGVRVIDPTNIDWILYEGGDLAQHYFGWAFYRNADWTFPIGMMDTLGYPYPTSVIYLDAIPLFAVMFKLLSPILPAVFQYLGLWGLMCFMLQGAVSAAICSRYTRSGAQTVLCSLLFIVAPIVMDRMFYHTALASHWVILLGLLLVLRHDTLSQKPLRALCLWGLLGVISASVHQYFVLFCGVLCFAYSLFEILKNKRWYGFLPCVVFIVFGGFADYVLGAFSANVQSLPQGFTEYSLNLNALYNPQWSSRMFDTLPYRDGQHEGFAYLGGGIIILCYIAAATLLVDYQTRPEDAPTLGDDLKRQWVSFVVFGTICLIFLVLALSPLVTLNDRVLFQWRLPAFVLNIWSIFRATGRLIWPVSYMIILAAVIACVKRQSRWLTAIVLVLCVGLQFYDLSGYMEGKQQKYQNHEYTSPLTKSYWDQIGTDDELKHLVMSDAVTSDNYQYPLADIASRQKWTLNTFYFARTVSGIYGTFQDTLENPQDDTLVVVLANEYDKVASENFAYLYEFDGLVVALNRPAPETVPAFDFKKHMEEIRIIGDGQNMSDGEDIDGVRHIRPGGISYGPYAFLMPGVYEATIQGTNLDKAHYDCVSDYGESTYELEDLQVSPTEVRYHFEIEKPTRNIELRVFNRASDDVVTITAFTVE